MSPGSSRSGTNTSKYTWGRWQMMATFGHDHESNADGDCIIMSPTTKVARSLFWFTEEREEKRREKVMQRIGTWSCVDVLRCQPVWSGRLRWCWRNTALRPGGLQASSIFFFPGGRGGSKQYQETVFKSRCYHIFYILSGIPVPSPPGAALTSAGVLCAAGKTETSTKQTQGRCGEWRRIPEIGCGGVLCFLSNLDFLIFLVFDAFLRTTGSSQFCVWDETKALDLQPAWSLRAFGELKSKWKRNPSGNVYGQSSLIYRVMTCDVSWSNV